MKRPYYLTLLLAAFFVSTFSLSAQERGVLGEKAGSWGASHWIQLPKGHKENGGKNLGPSDFSGKVLYLYCFQSWCPGCHSQGFPMLKKVSDHYQDDPDVSFVSIQTVFEGHSTNTPSQVSKMAERYGFSFPMAHSGSKSSRSKIMKNYRTGGTPWVIIIDKKGVVRYNAFHISEEKAKKLIEKLKAE